MSENLNYMGGYMDMVMSRALLPFKFKNEEHRLKQYMSAFNEMQVFDMRNKE